MEKGNKMLIPLHKYHPENYINNNESSCSKVITPYVSHVTSSVDWINKTFTKLDINCKDTKIESDVNTDDKCLAGNVQSIISSMSLVLIQPLLPNLLYLDTPLFLYDPNSQLQDSTNYVYLGKINDIFGSVNDPIYSIYSTLEKNNVLNIGDKVYFSPNNPDTQFMYIERTLNNNFNIIKKKRINK